MTDLSLDRDEGKPTSTYFGQCRPKVRDMSLFQRLLKSMPLLRNSVLKFSKVPGASSIDKMCSLFTKLTSKTRRKEAEEPEA